MAQSLGFGCKNHSRKGAKTVVSRYLPVRQGNLGSHGKLCVQRARVDRCSDLRVVVEIGEDVTGDLVRWVGIGSRPARVVRFKPYRPQLDPRCKMVESLARIAARIELLGAVQTQI